MHGEYWQELYSKLAKERMIIYILGFCAFAIHFVVAAIPNDYSFFSDEYYYLACSERLSFGYVDAPPLSILLLFWNKTLFGSSLLATRIVPALCSAASSMISAHIVIRLGGRGFAIALTMIATAMAPISLIVNSFYSMNCLEFFLWILIVFYLIRIIQEGDLKLFVSLGFIVGLAYNTRQSVLLLLLAILPAMFMRQYRHFFRSKHFWRGVVIAIALCIPNAIWEIQNDFPTVSYLTNIVLRNPDPIGPIENLFYQISNIGPISIFVCGAGIYYLLVYANYHKLQFIPIAFFILLTISMFSFTQRPSRIAPIYPPLFAAGAVFVWQWIEKYKSTSLKIISISFVLFFGLSSGLCVLSILPPYDLSNFSTMLGLSHKQNPGNLAVTHSFLSERLGWEGIAEKTISLCKSLPPSDKQNLVVLARNKSEAAAIEYYDDEKVTKMVLCCHNNYYIWFPNDYVFETVVSVGFSRTRMEEFFEKVEDSGLFHTSTYAPAEENNMRFFICRSPKYPTKRIKEVLKSFY